MSVNKASMSIGDIRRDYSSRGLERDDLSADPLAQFQRWFQEAINAVGQDANAMTLATADADGVPSARIVLLKGMDERGFQFFTNYTSRKARELETNPNAALVFYWSQLERQVCIIGQTQQLSRQESIDYFQSRPRGSRLGAWASSQDQVITDRQVLEQRFQELQDQYPDADIPTPDNWGGFVLAPERIEFWQGRPNRLHDRFVYTRTEDGHWRIDRLAP